MTTADKLTYIQGQCLGKSCFYCKLDSGTTCPRKNWNEWTPEEIETAYNILFPDSKELEFVKVAHEEAESEEKDRFTEKKIIHTALHSFGADKQRIKCIEEMSELIKELCKDGIGEGKPFHIAEEIADVEIMLAQMKIHYGAEKDVEAVKAQKLRQLAEKLNIETRDD